MRPQDPWDCSDGCGGVWRAVSPAAGGGIEPCPCPASHHGRPVPQLLQALHRLTRLVVFRDLSSAEAILALFPETFHQNLKNLLTKIILEHV